MSKTSSSACGMCGKNFINLYNLRRHIKRFHPSEIQRAPPLQLKNKNNYKYGCDQCHKYFNNVYKFNQHNKKVHDLSQISVNFSGKKKCSLCEYSFSTKIDIIKHFEVEHDCKIESKSMEFPSLEEFKKWKSATCVIVLAFIKLEVKGKGILKLKEGRCQTHITITHVGHHNEIQHLKLTELERRNLAIKLAAKKPFDCILDEIRDTVEGTDLKRLHLLNKKDLYNIEKSFNLSSTVVRHSNDAVSVESWINEVKEECVLFYKPQDTTTLKHPELKSEDFVLVLMNAAQVEMLQTFGSDCICVDGTHGLNSYNFEMNTVLVIDDMRQGFPCAFLVSNRSDEVVFNKFFFLRSTTGWTC
ncbi:hypothetical protein NQ315_014940 [Exocentrus adspersus]|uniref:C2H2-type domain-containing protein n=1 Tax=Exocentrus adspersus TaxID=1586481 RepID=A0AAV8VAQ3_9CUCU|nr:hypothetical protein NQ315_014940 [Exocentrus adspersus]